MYFGKKDKFMTELQTKETISYDGLNSLPEALESCMDKYSELTAITDTYNNISLTYTELKEKIELFASGLQHLGVKKGDKIGMFSENHGLWMSISLGILKCGAVDVVRGSNAPIEELQYIAMNADCKGLILRDIKLYNSLKPYLEKYKFDFIIITYTKNSIDTSNVISPIYSYEEIIGLGKKHPFEHVDISRNDDCTILYTSGTTGNPKGVLLSHNNLVYQIEVCHSGFLSMPGENTLQILPIWHAYERIGQCYYLSRGCHMHFTTLAGLKNDLAKYDINTLMSVPRIWEALRTGIYQKLKQTSPRAFRIFEFAVKVSILYKTHKSFYQQASEFPV